MQSEFKKSKDIVLYYQVLLYDILKKTELFHEDGKASEDDKLMFKEITEMNIERMRIDEYEERHLLRPNPKKSLIRLTTFVDEVHDILKTLNIRAIMRIYWSVMEEKD